MNEKDEKIYVYEYLDLKESEMRKYTVSKIIEGEEVSSNSLNFLELGIYDKKNSFNNAVGKSIYDNKILLTPSQMEILCILEEDNLFLSAPTSFGKTFIVLEYIARHQELNNIVFIVPTLALMNELLKKMYNNFSEYNICINSGESKKDKNIFIFVPERSDINFINNYKNIQLDLLIIDEIYKLKADKNQLNTDDRIIIMNKVYLDLLKIAKKIVLLAPFVREITFQKTNLDIVRYYTNYSPIYNNVFNKTSDNWIDYIGKDKELVFFNSPQNIYDSMETIISKIPESSEYIERYKKEIEHLETKISKNWYVILLLKRGIGIHHGKTPIFLRKFYEEEYREGNLKSLICTNTLMEGINTPTIRLLIVDNPGSSFKINNLIGRVGRLNTKNPQKGEIFIFNNKAYNNFNQPDSWEKLTILAESPKTTSNDEILFLDKKPLNEQKKIYDEKISYIIEKTGVTIDELKEMDIKVDTAYDFGKENYIEKFNRASNVKECVDLTIKLMKIKISYKFKKNKFENLNYYKEYLPYKIFISSILRKIPIKKIVDDFQDEVPDLSIKNNSLLIDLLLELKTLIKFKISKILNYFDLYDKSLYSICSKNFANLLKTFTELTSLDKIFDDLGIEEDDFSKLNIFFQEKNNISTSDVIHIIDQNQKKLEDAGLSPFTRINIRKMINKNSKK